MTTDSATNATSPGNDSEGEPEDAPATDQVQESSSEASTGESAATGTGSAGGFAAGAGAVISAGLGLASLTGTSLGEMLKTRKEIIGQIESGTGGGGDQIEAFYGAPWDVAALINGITGLIAVVLGGVLLAALARRADAHTWVKAVALGGAVLGVIGLLVAGGMYFDLFASAPELPQQPAPGMGG
ncbi:hypothetical protein SAMN06265360_101152 [Haloechinothrix alba]|uniref:Uncharacterized protein n=1 Tax=Haloechinothrix alba TaxID=664784 RepID=A0A238V1Q5_9PSEU|nr:hypothetical protein [Haloechinothrix alba]SNR28004.1 hypothetical protein SAMN06265360_101152 [Haloechinothrix alba]